MLPEILWILPFALLLLSIAVLPLINKHWWEKSYPWVSLGFGLLVFSHYFFDLKDISALVHAAQEYLGFIVIMGALFTVAGGIHLDVQGEAKPLDNCRFLLTGAVLANFIGTTGASMILIRPWMRMNKYRLTTYHIVFFIFIVSNIGGGLTPIGDPPLFLGYLRGVPFFWVLENVWPMWLVALGILMTVFFILDSRNFKRAPKEIRRLETERREKWRFRGRSNIFFLLVIIGAVFINDPPLLREALMILAAVLSYRLTPKEVHERNDFNFGPIKEVAILFAGIFVTMIPALQWLEHNATAIGIRSVGQFFWASGLLSGALDNAPTYLNFLSAAMGLFGTNVSELVAAHPAHLRAISVASVFFGAMTYIGNGPNFLVKSIADHAKAKTPSFFGYIFSYSLPFLLPTFTIVWFFFFRS